MALGKSGCLFPGKRCGARFKPSSSCQFLASSGLLRSCNLLCVSLQATLSSRQSPRFSSLPRLDLLCLEPDRPCLVSTSTC
eukprot:scaffold75767_cov28-Tisochrysis_lutea.AAC.5